MTLDLASFHQACSPIGASLGANKQDPYYIDLSQVRGRALIAEFKQAIATSATEPTCQLLATQAGRWHCQELQRLKAMLEEEGWHVVYCLASQELDLADVQILDLLLMLVDQISTSLSTWGISLNSKYFNILFRELKTVLHFPVEAPPYTNLSAQLSQVITHLKENPYHRQQIRIYLESRIEQLLSAINQDLIQSANEQLRQRNKKGLVVIIDELERVEQKRLPSGRDQLEFLFIDQGTLLHQINCHLVCTIPLALMFSKEYEVFQEDLRGGVAPQRLPMIPVRRRDGSDCEEGIALLRQVILVRAFPDVEPEQRLDLITEIFDSPETLDRLCRVSGGHVRSLLGLLYKCFWEEKPPISRNSVEKVITEYRNSLASAVDQQEWTILRKVQISKQVNSNPDNLVLIASRFVYEYHDNLGSWFELNPVLAETEQLRC